MSAPAETVLRPGVLNGPVKAPTLRVSLPDPNGPNPPSPGNGREAAYCVVDDGTGERQVRFKGDPHLWEWAGVYEHLVRRHR